MLFLFPSVIISYQHCFFYESSAFQNDFHFSSLMHFIFEVNFSFYHFIILQLLAFGERCDLTAVFKQYFTPVFDQNHPDPSHENNPAFLGASSVCSSPEVEICGDFMCSGSSSCAFLLVFILLGIFSGLLSLYPGLLPN